MICRELIAPQFCPFRQKIWFPEKKRASWSSYGGAANHRVQEAPGHTMLEGAGRILRALTF